MLDSITMVPISRCEYTYMRRLQKVLGKTEVKDKVGTVGKEPPGMTASHMGVLELKPWLASPFQLPAKLQPGTSGMASVLGSLLPRGRPGWNSQLPGLPGPILAVTGIC